MIAAMGKPLLCKRRGMIAAPDIQQGELPVFKASMDFFEFKG
jgi:hypothetical protein